LYGNGEDRRFSGRRAADHGNREPDAGFYAGSYSGIVTGEEYGIVAADGTFFFYATGAFPEGVNAGFGKINDFNTVRATLATPDDFIEGQLNSETHTITGMFGHTDYFFGSITLRRVSDP
jgi:hypothetical protein